MTDTICVKSNLPIVLDSFGQFYSVLYAVPTTLLYGVIVYCFRSQSHLYSGIYQDLITVSSACNVLCWWLQFLFVQFFGFSPWCQYWVDLSGEYQLTVPYFIYICSPIANFIACSAICVYQLFAIIYPTTYEMSFRKWMWLFYLSLIMVPVVCSIHILFSNTQIVPISNTRVYVRVTHYYDWMDFLTTTRVNAIVGGLTCLIIFPCSIISATCFYQVRKKNNGTARLRSFIVNLVICASTVVFIIFQVLLMTYKLFTTGREFLIILYGIRAYVADVCYLPIPWVILIVNPRIRDAIMAIFRTKTTTMVSPKQTTSI